MKNEEKLSFYDEELNEFGIALRSEIHSKGLLHQVVHCWIIDDSSDEKWIYFQQRSYEKKDFPGLYDISAAGHVDIGEEMEAALKREVQEEIGIEIDSKKLKFIGSIREQLHLDKFTNNEICQVYLYMIENPQFYIGYEVEKMVKVPFNEFKKLISGDLEHIIAFSIDNKSKYSIKSQEFCVHTKEYLEFVMDFIGKLLLIK
jgi:isopentenyldiphosphate isomerase